MTAPKTADEGKSRRLFTRWWERRKQQAFPAGAIRFHLSGWARSALTPEEAQEAQALLRSWDFDALYVLHGNALRTPRDGALIVLGPPGIGKSTACYAMVRQGHAELVEDGLVVVGCRQDRWHVLQTGTIRVLSRASRIGAWLRRVTRIGSSIFLDAEVQRSGYKWRIYRFRARVAFFLSILSARDGESFSPSLLPVARLIVAQHPAAVHPDLRIDRSAVLRPICDVSSWVPGCVEVRTVSGVGHPADVRERLQRAMLDCDSSSTMTATGT